MSTRRWISQTLIAFSNSAPVGIELGPTTSGPHPCKRHKDGAPSAFFGFVYFGHIATRQEKSGFSGLVESDFDVRAFFEMHGVYEADLAVVQG